ncbi:unnamed protein product [Rotaria socialis]|uniref:Uncharacterized protein n=1 Tax=Rotaria socialis TaxID=392032 RepID=A0A818SDQ5_9BILA|nr:unnamed protein product [Rotaria socialis]CAF4435106.1 unnamed protein product [Rotaria socialis]
MKHENKDHSCFELVQLLISISIPIAIGIHTVLENNCELTITNNNRQQDLDLADSEKKKDLILRECQKILRKVIERYGTQIEENTSGSLVARSKLITYRSDEYRPPVLLQSANLPDLNLIAESERRVLYNLSLEGIIMTSADFYEINIRGARLNSSILNHVDFSSPWNTPSFDDEIGTFKSNSSQLLFEKTNLTYASFVFVTNEKAAFTLTIMDNASLGAFFSCSNCIFDFTDMAGVNFEKC